MSNQNHQRNSSANKMLIDATHPEETRVVVLRHGRVEEFDYESAARKLLRGNIYLAKVTRVEPSLQAAFVDYGGNRHGFLAFNEIHPDYYQIPIADRRALLEAEAQAEAEEEEEAERAAQDASRRRQRGRPRRGQRPESRGSEEDGAVEVSHLLPPEPHEHEPHEHESHDREPHDVEPHVRHEHGDEPHEAEPYGEPRHDEPHAHGPDDDAPRSLSESIGTSEARLASPSAEPLEQDEPAGGHAREFARDHADHGHHTHDHEHDHVHGGTEPHHEHRSHDTGEPAYIEPAYREAADGDESPVSDAPHAIGLVEEVGVADIDNGNGSEAEQVEQVETVASEQEDALEELQSRPRRRLRSYKIQEVIKRRQVILVQVVKEERGTKGAALTTYLSLAGRYTVLMPNTARGGGISRKITNAQDRKRLKAIADELEVEEGMGLIIRTAGAARTRQEIKRDYEYLLRLWESVREVTLASVAPTLVYEEGNLIKRSIRDLYGKDVEEVVVAGDVAHHEAQDFMRMLMPAHAKNVHNYVDAEPLFSRYQIERQLNAMFSPYVHLRSGGYLVINQTEALVSIDINSGKATREFSIEETAYATNLEAADEIARQLKLRDLAGLIVIDFIDMEEKRNNRAVERRLKDALRFDRARIQVGHISHFGLLEMSRQRLRTGVLEGSTTQCPHCQGTGIIRSTESVALAVLRGLEDALMTGQPASLIAATTPTVALYILNHKRAFITEMESRYGVTIHIIGSDKVQGANFTIERQAVRRDDVQRRPERAAVSMDWGFEGEAEDAAAEEDEEPVEAREPAREPARESARDTARDTGRDTGRDSSRDSERDGDGENGDGRRRRRRRRGRGRRDEQPGAPIGQREPRADRPQYADEGEHGGAPEGSRNGYGRAHGETGGYDEVGGGEPADLTGANAPYEAEGDVEPVRTLHGGEEVEQDGAEGGDGQRNGAGRRGRRRGRRGGRRGGQGRPFEAEGSADSTGLPSDAPHQGEHLDVDIAGADQPSMHAGSEHTSRADVESGEDGPRHFADAPEVADPAAIEARPASRSRGRRHDRSDRGRHGDEPRAARTFGAGSEPAADVPMSSERAVRHHEPEHREDAANASAWQRREPAPEPAPPVPAFEPVTTAEPAPAPVTASEPPPAPRRSTVSGEPVLERVVVGPHSVPAAEEPRPARRGWWQRK